VTEDLERRSHAVLKAALEIEGPQREAFLEEACAGDTAMRRKVRSLVSALEDSRGFLDSPALDGARSDEHVPQSIGPYRIVRVLGAGGMATVYEAIQDRPRRHVAIKVMKRGLERTSALRRFEFETEVLARLRHPGIAQIYEAGTHRDEHHAPVPFFAMEFVEGARTITAYARDGRLDLRHRLEMFADVCDAVHHGHQNGIIHRDLKPGNILVGADGRAKVIDFGVARSSEMLASPSHQTEHGQLVGTLNYMSPEQCAGETPIDVRTDVYSLGVLLYELLCGRVPHDITALPLPEALRVVMQDIPARPSAINPAFRGDIDAIVLKAIDKDSNRRYSSAAALATDIRRHLSHQTVEARPPTVLYQCRQFARRNRVLVSAGAAVLLALLGGGVLSALFAYEATKESRQRRIAEDAAIAERDAALWKAYVANIAAGVSSLQAGEYALLRRRLAEAPQQHRGWEWRFLSGVADRTIFTVVAADDMIHAFASSQDGSRFATGSRDGMLRVWNSDDGTLVSSARTGPAPVLSVAYSPDGATLVSGTLDCAVRVWDARSGREIAHLGDMERQVEAVAIGRDSLIAAAYGAAVRLWSGPRFEPAGELRDQPNVHGVAIHADADCMLTWNRAGAVWVRNADGTRVRLRLEFPGIVQCTALSDNGELLAVGGENGQIMLWNARTGNLVLSLRTAGSVSTVRSLAFTPDGTMLASGQIDRTIVLWSLEQGRELARLQGHEEAVGGLRFSADGSRLISASWDRTVRCWDIDNASGTNATRVLRGHVDRVIKARFTSDGSMLATTSDDSTVRVWDPELGLEIGALQGHRGPVFGLDISPDDRLIASGSNDLTVRLWDARTGASRAELTGHSESIWSVAFSPDGRRLASGSTDSTIRVWDVRSARLERVLRGHAARVTCVEFSPDGRLLASASRDQTVGIWDVETGARLRTLEGHRSDVWAVVFDRSGSRLYSGSRDQVVRTWDTATFECVHDLTGHGQLITSLSLSPDGSRLAAGSWFGQILVWDIPTRELVASFRGHDTVIPTVSFSPDGRWLVSTSYDRSIRLFDSATQAEQKARAAWATERMRDAKKLVEAMFARFTMPDQVLNAIETDPNVDPVLRPFVLKEVLRRSLSRDPQARTDSPHGPL